MSAREKYNRIAKLYDLLEGYIEKKVFSNFRKELFKHIEGKILELGVGTGKNFPYYSKNLKGYAVDFSEKMLEVAKKRKEELGLKNIEILQMDIENLEFEDETFDTVFSSFVFCTVPNPIKGLQEARRVLKKDGKAVFLEHMKSSNFINNIFLYLMNPFTKLFLGTSMIRETDKNIEKAGFKIVKTYYLHKDIVRLIIARK
ncbi:class I SAM-dependent methyltransferase [Thermosipho atlanticus]|uniref:Ubiquinone/menaquinone biosynthesis C-methylase UbiE n=1 Tax=Thermosipho atlanticus DSM 15807 TaxID=1123380 RepID=A0A1M5QVM9_9BACT|nr:class I SAM-dependent methyltransferase [Thermosipho atlanticus]SHH17926.1 Ubiquinone/menaquinone biosynthesis C-methylase UbiE [Thermosipho atlanticus DSM 15807]